MVQWRLSISTEYGVEIYDLEWTHGRYVLSLVLFGTDQSQVQRYISASSIKESRMGLMFNAILKIPMQAFILLTGVLLFVFYQINEQPISFNQQVVEVVMESIERRRGSIYSINLAEYRGEK